MPRGCKPTGDHALSNAERQARYRARQQVASATAVTRPRGPTDRRSRPQRWRDAVGTLLTLQAQYTEWLTALPDSLQGSATADALEAIVDLDLTPLLTLSHHAVTGVIKPTIDRPNRRVKKIA